MRQFLYARNSSDSKVQATYLVDDKFVTFTEEGNAMDLEISSFGRSVPIKKVAAFINPKSGSGKSLSDWQKVVKPFFIDSGKFQVALEVITENIGHAQKAAACIDEDIEGVITLGGDGLINEVVNGLYSSGRLHVPVYPLPCGSGNGLVSSVFAASGKQITLRAALRAVIAGNTQQVDLFEVSSGQKRRIAFLSVTFGIVADTDIGSERLRCCGSSRFTLCGLIKIARNRAYQAKVTFSTDGVKDELFDGSFSSITAFNLSHASTDFIAATERSLSDGYMSLVCMRNPGRIGLIKTMLSAELGNQAEKCQWWRPVDVKRFTIDVGLKGVADAGIVVDGEKWFESTITASIVDDKLTTFLP